MVRGKKQLLAGRQLLVREHGGYCGKSDFGAEVITDKLTRQLVQGDKSSYWLGAAVIVRERRSFRNKQLFMAYSIQNDRQQPNSQ